MLGMDAGFIVATLLGYFERRIPFPVSKGGGSQSPTKQLNRDVISRCPLSTRRESLTTHTHLALVGKFPVALNVGLQ